MFGKVLIQLPTVDSTNEYAKQLLAKTKPVEGTAIIAYEQTLGRGQFGNKWSSSAGKDLILSIILFPGFLPVSGQFLLSRAISLGIREAIQFYLKEPVKIKWPNDIYCGERKLAGILIENSLQGSKIADTIVGIGLNVNSHEFNDLPLASSISILANEEINMDQLFHRLMTAMEKWYLLLKGAQRDRIRQQYLQHLYQRDEWHQYKSADGEFTGRIIGVNEGGQLAIETNNGLRYFSNKEVTYL